MKRGSVAIVLAALLAATIVGVVWARPNQAPEGVIRKVTIPAAAFHPYQDGTGYYNSGLILEIGSGSGYFTAPVVFPCVERVAVKKVTLSVDDQNASANACVSLYRASPKNLTQLQMAHACSTGSGGETNYSDNTIENAQVYPSHGPYLYLSIPATYMWVYGVTIEYRRQM